MVSIGLQDKKMLCIEMLRCAKQGDLETLQLVIGKYFSSSDAEWKQFHHQK